MEKIDIVVVGAGAAGLMCAIEAGKRDRMVRVLEHVNKPGKKILMSGGGRCNFTNYQIHHSRYLSHNKHFCKSALSRYTQWNFIDLVHQYNIPFFEKTQGQLFCVNKSMDILNMLLTECSKVNATVSLNTKIETVERINDRNFLLKTNHGNFNCQALVIASGGLSIPTLGASPFGYKIAEKFAIKVWPTRAGLVPITLHSGDKARLQTLSGISVASTVMSPRAQFGDILLFTHRGLSGPVILQCSSYWQTGEELVINFLPELNLMEHLKMIQKKQPLLHIKTVLSHWLPNRVIEVLLPSGFNQRNIADISYREFEEIETILTTWVLKPNGTEGYRTAEVTLGGVDCNAISSKTMEANAVPGLYFIGEVLDVSGWLGGYNFQWAWSSGWCAGQVV